MRQDRQKPYLPKLLALILFGIAMGFLEAAVVVYLRELFYPRGFTFPLATMPERLIMVEIAREASTLVMLGTVAYAVSRRFWEGFGWFLILFGVWDIFYYVWLRVAIGWPSSLTDWDILFLIPAPWVGPVIAPVLVAALMIVLGIILTVVFHAGYEYRPSIPTWILAVAATGVILFSFMRDTGAGIRQELPAPYPYYLLYTGLALYAVAFIISLLKIRRESTEMQVGAVDTGSCDPLTNALVIITI